MASLASLDRFRWKCQLKASEQEIKNCLSSGTEGHRSFFIEFKSALKEKSSIYPILKVY